MAKSCHSLLCIAAILMTNCGKYTAESQEEALAQASKSAIPTFSLSPVQLLNYMNSGLSTVIYGEMASTLPGPGLKSALKVTNTPSGSVPQCTDDGWAFDVLTGTYMASTHPLWAARTIFCQVNAEAGNLENVQTSYAWAAGILCKLEASQSLTFAETPQDFTAAITVEPNDSCFPSNFFNNPARQGLSFSANVTTQKLSNDAHGWTQQLRIHAAEQNLDETLKLVSEGDFIAISSSAGWSFSLDYVYKTLRFARLNKAFDENFQLLASGDIDASHGTFQYVDRLESIYSGGFRIASVAGYSMTGYKSQAYEAVLADYSQTYVNSGLSVQVFDHLSAQCLGGYCQGIEGLVFDSDYDLSFLLQPGSLDANGLLSFAPLNFYAVDYLTLE